MLPVPKIKYSNKYNVIIVCLTLIVCLFVIITNFIIDPMNVFKTFYLPKINAIKTCETKQERVSKIPQIKLDKSYVEQIFVGSSKTGWPIDDEYLNYLGRQKNLIKRETMNGSRLQESIILAKSMIFLHPELKKIYIGVDFYSLGVPITAYNDDFKVISQNGLTFDDIKPLLLSLNTFQYSIDTFIKNLKFPAPQKTFVDYKDISNFKPNYVLVGSEAEYKFQNRVADNYKTNYKQYSLNPNNFKDLKEFIDFAKEHNVEVVCFVTTSHVTDLINIYESHIWDEYNHFKKELSKICNYYDFSIVNKYTTEDVNPQIYYFRDSVHGSPYLGKIIIDRLMNKSEEFGIFITPQNVDKEIAKNEQRLKQYMDSHPDVVKQVVDWRK